MRKKIVAGNWKMNLTEVEALELFQGVNTLPVFEELSVAIFPPMLYIQKCVETGTAIQIGAQNGYTKPFGAYTGEVSMHQLKSAGVNAVLIGHSERRLYFNEDNQFLKEKVDAALEAGIQPYFCCGEELELREVGQHLTFVKTQLEESVFHLSAEDFSNVVLAYEPIWAIGTGLTASAEQAEEMHAAIRTWVEQRYSKEVAANCSILYGGSCNPSNAASLFACPNVDGGLIGGAALKLSDFAVLVAKETWITSN